MNDKDIYLIHSALNEIWLNLLGLFNSKSDAAKLAQLMAGMAQIGTIRRIIEPNYEDLKPKK